MQRQVSPIRYIRYLVYPRYGPSSLPKAFSPVTDLPVHYRLPRQPSQNMVLFYTQRRYHHNRYVDVFSFSWDMLLLFTWYRVESIGAVVDLFLRKTNPHIYLPNSLLGVDYRVKNVVILLVEVTLHQIWCFRCSFSIRRSHIYNYRVLRAHYVNKNRAYIADSLHSKRKLQMSTD